MMYTIEVIQRKLAALSTRIIYTIGSYTLWLYDDIQENFSNILLVLVGQ